MFSKLFNTVNLSVKQARIDDIEIDTEGFVGCPSLLLCKGLQVYSCWVDAKSRDCSWFSNYYPIALPWWVLPDLALSDLGSQLSKQFSPTAEKGKHNPNIDNGLCGKLIHLSIDSFWDFLLWLCWWCCWQLSGLRTINPAYGMSPGQTQGHDFTWLHMTRMTRRYSATSFQMITQARPCQAPPVQGTLSELTWQHSVTMVSSADFTFTPVKPSLKWVFFTC